ncbi:MAG: TIGR00341 family protein [Lentisphaeria bacterium]|nr:TIGR00341 family protein [Lentisphaeria bacterium]
MKHKIVYFFWKLLDRFIIYSRKEAGEIFSITPERIDSVEEEIRLGSAPKAHYFILMVLSVMIASLGLIINSAAVVIGAMLISPLMMPIFGCALGIITGDSQLLKVSLMSEFFGVFLAILSAVILGLLPYTSFEITSEIMSRTTPNLLDLGIAVFAGIAGGMALIDDRINSGLTGVAIATSLTPPLGACGLCFSMGHFVEGMGAFLLFFSNFMAIFSIAGGLFFLFGFLPKEKRREQWLKMQKPFRVTMGGLLVITIILTATLIRLRNRNKLAYQIRTIVEQEVLSRKSASVTDVIIKQREGRVSVLAFVRTLKEFQQIQVLAIERILREKTGKSNLFFGMRCTIAVDVVGSMDQNEFSEDFIQHFDFDPEDYHQSKGRKLVAIHESASQAIRNRFKGTLKTFNLDNLKIMPIKRNDKEILFIYAKVSGYRELFPKEVMNLENSLETHLKRNDIQLVVSCDKQTVIDAKGTVNFARRDWYLSNERARESNINIMNAIKPILMANGYKLNASSIHQNPTTKKWFGIFEVLPLSEESPAIDIKSIHEQLFLDIGIRVEISIIMASEYIYDKDGVWPKTHYLEKVYSQ